VVCGEGWIKEGQRKDEEQHGWDALREALCPVGLRVFERSSWVLRHGVLD